MNMAEPKNHHYLPIFYLSRWAGLDGKICRFHRPIDTRVVSKRVVPKGTAFEPHLYSVRTEGYEPSPDMEKTFFSVLDSRAATALSTLESGFPDPNWEAGSRSDWSRFVWSLSLRSPGELQQLRSSAKEAWSSQVPDLQEAYAKSKPEDFPEQVGDYLSQLDPEHQDRFALGIARSLMDHKGIWELINAMHWSVIRFDNYDVPLLTSDRPVWMTQTLTEQDAFLTMPIGPYCLFVAARTLDTMLRLKSRPLRQSVKNQNKITVQHAIRYVYGINDNMLPFVQKHFSTKRHSTHFERLASIYGHKIVDPKSPA